jgi:hypothetical protein
VTAASGLASLRSAALLRARVSAGGWLACLVCGSVVLRSLAAFSHGTPDYFPDEYIYASLGRSLGSSGRPLVRGETAHFPALLEPLLTAPLWALGSVETAYRLVQLENALFMSLAAVPVYLLARRLELSSGFALACAAFALLVPDLAFSSFIVADPVAYPLVVTAVLLGVRALQTPSRGSQLAFVALVAACTLARVQFVVLAPAFVIAAFALDRRSAFRMHRLPLIVFTAATAVAGLLGATRLLGYYDAVARLHVSGSFFRWAGIDLVFLSLAGAFVLVPGAVVGLLTARERRDRAFAALVLPLAGALMIEAALYAGNGSDRFKERYLFVLLPLVPIAFGLYRRNRRPMRVAVTSLACAIALGAAILPLTHFVKGFGYDDSPLLWAYLELQWQLGSTGASIVMTGAVLAATGLAIAATWRRLHWPAVGVALVLLLALSVGATALESSVSAQATRESVAANPSWIDATGVGPVAAIQTDLAPTSPLTEQLFWNRSITSELLFGSKPEATDPLSTGTLVVSPNGGLFTVPTAATPASGTAPAPLRTAFLFQNFEVSARLSGAVLVARYSTFALWRPTAIPRLGVYEVGRYWDGWLAPRGGLEVWPSGERGGTVSFTLSLPRSRPHGVTVRFANFSVPLRPGEHRLVRVKIPGGKAWSSTFATVSGSSRLRDNRAVSVRSTTPLFTPSGV